MHSSIFITSLFAALAIASPLHQALHKKAYVYDVLTEIVTVTVTAGDEPVTVAVQKTVYVNPVAAPTTKPSPKTRRPRPTTSKAAPPPPPPAPTTTSVAPPPPPPVYTTEAPAPVYVAPPKQPEYVVPTQAKVVAPVEPVKTSPPTAAGPSSNSGDSIKDAALNFHNQVRAKHHVGSVTWDDALAADAATLAQSCTNRHSITGSYGQNIASSADSTPNSKDGKLDQVMKNACSGWYDEVKDFGGLFGQSNVGNTGVLHFTQVVWKATTKIGCAVNYCGTQGNIFPPSGNFQFYAYTIVCNYASAGNFGGQYASNVFAA